MEKLAYLHFEILRLQQKLLTCTHYALQWIQKDPKIFILKIFCIFLEKFKYKTYFVNRNNYFPIFFKKLFRRNSFSDQDYARVLVLYNLDKALLIAGPTVLPADP